MVINLLLGVFTDVKNDRLHCLLWYLQKMQHCFVNARRRVVHLATRVKIRPVVLSGSLPPLFHPYQFFFATSFGRNDEF